MQGFEFRAAGAVQFAETATRYRATAYRERAAHLMDMAEAEPIGKLRGQLVALARQYEELANKLDHEPTRGLHNDKYPG